jgi:nitrite reductase/ring-hydroxylating ferredoxin subunit
MQRKIWVSRIEDFGPGSRRVVDLGAYQEALVLNVDGIIYALNNVCPHAGAALERGPIHGTVIECPLHRWSFELTTGICIQDPTLCARIYTVEMDTEHLFLCLP